MGAVARWLGLEARQYDGEAGPDYTAIRTAEAIEAASWGAIDAIAIAEAIAGLWSRAMAAGRLTVPGGGPGAAMRAEALNAECLALAGRSLIIRGEAVFGIGVTHAGRVRLWPASTWDVWGGPAPESWRYRLDLVGPTGTETLYAPAAEVLHLRTGCDTRQPWRGVSPLLRARVTAATAWRLEAALQDDSRMPVQRLAAFPEMSAPQAQDQLAAQIKRKGISAVFGREGSLRGSDIVGISGPGPKDTMLEARRDVAASLAFAAGVPPELVTGRGDGAAAREAYRRFLWAGVAPVAASMLPEIADKLDIPGARFDWAELAAADTVARARALRGTVDAIAGLVRLGFPLPDAVRLSELETGDMALPERAPDPAGNAD